LSKSFFSSFYPFFFNLSSVFVCSFLIINLLSFMSFDGAKLRQFSFLANDKME